MAKKPDELHVLMVPFFSQSHMIPLTDFARLLAERGVSVTILSSPLNEPRFKNTIEIAEARNLKIRTLPVDFPGPQFGLPPEVQNLHSLDFNMELIWKFFRAMVSLQQPVMSLVEEMDTKPHAIITTPGMNWTQPIADRYGIPLYVFQVVSCFAMACSAVLEDEEQMRGVAETDTETFVIPNIPHEIEFSRVQMPRHTSESVGRDGAVVAPAPPRGTLANSFQELEPWYSENCGGKWGKVFCVGPVSLVNRDPSEKASRGNPVDEEFWQNWLNSREEKSVIYACFGGLSRMKYEQIRELGLALEKSNFPFIWVLREKEITEDVKMWLQEFEPRIAERGFVCKGWAPQFLILSHPAIGGFLSHCGWSSVIEAIVTGVPLIAWPMFSDQFFHEKLIADVLRIGVRIGVRRFIDDVDAELITSDKLDAGIQNLMRSAAGKDARKRVKELAGIASKVLEEGGSSSANISMFIEDVIEQQQQPHH